MLHSKKTSSSWEKVHDWYDKAVGFEGHYYHQQVILPNIFKNWNLNEDSSVLDIACGQGILARHLPPKVAYTGIDISPSLITNAKKRDANSHHQYLVADVTKLKSLTKKDFTHAAIILALQNIEQPEKALQLASHHLQKNGKLLLVINHPCYRIPRQSSWQIDEKKKIQFRRVDGYLSRLKIPIQSHPGSKDKSESTYSYHWPLSLLTQWLNESKFKISLIEEWISDKQSTGSKAKMENRARQEFPLFMAIFAEKL